MLDTQPPSSSWFASFLALDGAQALLDVLSHSQTRATHEPEEGEVQVQCVSCLAAVIKRRAGMEAVLARPHAVTCLLAALELKSSRVQREVLELLLRVALTPQGTAKLLSSCEALRPSQADKKRLARLCGLLAAGSPLEFEVGVLKLLCLMVDGPAEADTRAQARGRGGGAHSPLVLTPHPHCSCPCALPSLHRTRRPTLALLPALLPAQVREELIELRVLDAAAGSPHAAEKGHLRYTSHLQHVLLRSELAGITAADLRRDGEAAGGEELGDGTARRLWTARDASQMQTAWELQHELRLALGSTAADAGGGGGGAGGVGGVEGGGGSGGGGGGGGAELPALRSDVAALLRKLAAVSTDEALGQTVRMLLRSVEGQDKGQQAATPTQIAVPSPPSLPPPPPPPMVGRPTRRHRCRRRRRRLMALWAASCCGAWPSRACVDHGKSCARATQSKAAPA